MPDIRAGAECRDDIGAFGAGAGARRVGTPDSGIQYLPADGSADVEEGVVAVQFRGRGTGDLRIRGQTVVIAAELTDKGEIGIQGTPDARCVAGLAELEADEEGRLEVIHADALQLDLAELAGGAPTRIVANLPYNIATSLLIGWLGQVTAFQSMTLMFQKEVAQRLGARAGDPPYGRLSVITSWLCEVELLFDVSPKAFVPPPKVTSTVVHLTPRPEPLAPARMSELERVTGAAFGQRRKMLRSSLKPLIADPVSVLDELNIPPTARAEELDVEAFCAIARATADFGLRE